MELLLLMSFNFFLLFNVQATSEEYYYQALNAEISIEDKAFEKLKEILNDFTKDHIKANNNKILEIKIAEDCRKEESSSISCECGTHFKKDDAVCIPEGRVSVNGTITLKNEKYSNELTNPKSNTYRVLSERLTTQFSEYYSKLRWFQSLSIQKFSKGSVIVEFRMILDRPTVEGLDSIQSITNDLTNDTTGEAKLVTEGFVIITAPEGRVKSYITEELSCKTKRDIGEANWYLQREEHNITGIHGGTEVELTHDKPNNKSTANLKKTSHIWRGTYTCEFKEGVVSHQAHAFLDVAMLPEINIYSEPQFPNCKKNPSGKLNVLVTCAIKNTTEKYNISWYDQDFVPDSTKYEQGNWLNIIRKTIKCEETPEDLNVTCTFTNGLEQSKNNTLTIPVILTASEVCGKDGNWPIAKAGHKAKLHCEKGQRGERTRKCNSNGKWGTVISNCVNVDLDGISAQATDLQRGLGNFTEIAPDLFQKMKVSTQKEMNSTANIETSVRIFVTMRSVSVNRTEYLEGTIFSDFLASASNIINDSLKGSWNGSLAADYLQNVNGLLERIHIGGDDESTSDKTPQNVNYKNCSSKCDLFSLADVSIPGSNISVTGFRTLGQILPREIKNENVTMESRAIVLSINAIPQSLQTFDLKFRQLNRTQNHELHCVVWDPEEMKWSKDHCTWGGASEPDKCTCDFTSYGNRNRRDTQQIHANEYMGASFTVLMSKFPVILPLIDELTQAGLIVSIVSLIACLVIEFLVWNSVVKSSIAHFRHTAVVNISLCLLLADSSFLSTAFPQSTPSHWCRWLVVVKHYCFLAMFFWMLCLSLVLLHSLIFIFQRLRKKVYLGVSFSVGYVCPLIIVVLTVIAYDNGEPDSYYLTTTCWLKYEGLFRGSFYAFVMPVGIIVGINILSMLVVIAKLLAPSVSESRTQDDKDVIRSILKAVIFLTPVFGVTWIFGFFILVVDYTTTPLSEIVNYAFTVCNAFQGLFILLTACLGEKKVREALSVICSRNAKASKTSKGELSTSKTSHGSSSLKKK